MCGIYGIIIPKNMNYSSSARNHYTETFRKLAIANTIRGTDATGLMIVKKDGSIELYKKPVPTWNMVFDRSWIDKSEFKEDVVAIIGHARERSEKTWPNDENDAHPHHINNIYGVHNGTITNAKQMYDKEYTSDSKALFRFISENGFDEINKLNGSMALAFIFEEKPFEFLFVSDGRPLHFFQERGVFIFSSLYEHCSSVKVDNKQIWELKPENLMKINANRGNRKEFSSIKKLGSSSTYTSIGGYGQSYYTSSSDDEKCGACNGRLTTYSNSSSYTPVKIMSKELEFIGNRCSSCDYDRCDSCGKARVFIYKQSLNKANLGYNYSEESTNYYYLFNSEDQSGLSKRFMCGYCFSKHMNKNRRLNKFEINCHSCKNKVLASKSVFINRTKEHTVVVICMDCIIQNTGITKNTEMKKIELFALMDIISNPDYFLNLDENTTILDISKKEIEDSEEKKQTEQTEGIEINE